MKTKIILGVALSSMLLISLSIVMFTPAISNVSLVYALDKIESDFESCGLEKWNTTSIINAIGTGELYVDWGESNRIENFSSGRIQIDDEQIIIENLKVTGYNFYGLEETYVNFRFMVEIGRFEYTASPQRIYINLKDIYLYASNIGTQRAFFEGYTQLNISDWTINQGCGE